MSSANEFRIEEKLTQSCGKKLNWNNIPSEAMKVYWRSYKILLYNHRHTSMVNDQMKITLHVTKKSFTVAKFCLHFRYWTPLIVTRRLLALKRLGGGRAGQLDHPCGFSKTMSSNLLRNRVKPWFFVAFKLS